jgi:hypothetical protein
MGDCQELISTSSLRAMICTRSCSATSKSLALLPAVTAPPCEPAPTLTTPSYSTNSTRSRRSEPLARDPSDGTHHAPHAAPLRHARTCTSMAHTHALANKLILATRIQAHTTEHTMGCLSLTVVQGGAYCTILPYMSFRDPDPKP